MLQKAIFQRLDRNFNASPDRQMRVQFNPTEFSLNKGVHIAEIPIPGLDMPIQQFVRGQTEMLTLDLFFDSTEKGDGDSADPVTKTTDKFYQLIKIDPRTHAPPVCCFVWGGQFFPGSNMEGPWDSQNRENGFRCIVESVRQRFTYFNPAGVPLRAILSITLREYRTLRQQVEDIRPLSPDHTHTHLVREGDTLNRIAEELLEDPRAWRDLARHNGIVNPLDLEPGRLLEMPPLR